MGKLFPQKKEAPMDNNNKLIEKINHQLERYVEVITEGMSKPKKKFVHQMLFGIQASRDIKLSEVARSLDEGIKLIKTETRLSRNLQDEGIHNQVREQLIREGADKIGEDTVLSLDLTDISKRYAKKMDFLTWVWDGVEKKKTKGYWVLEVVGANVEEDYIFPLYSELYSQEAEDFESENEEIMRAIDRVNKYIKGKGIWVMDRGGDRKHLINQVVKRGLRFVIRIRGDRELITGGDNSTGLAREIATKLKCGEEYVLEIDEEGYKERRKLFLGRMRVRIPGIGGEYYLVVIKGFGESAMLLLTNVEGEGKKILEMYLTRWKVEESIRFLKQEYNLEDVRVRSYSSLKNTVTLLLAVFYFLSVYLGAKLKLNILLKKIYEKAKRFFQIPAFKQYAIADGIYRILFNTRWKYSRNKKTYRIETKQFMFSFLRT